MGIGAGRSRRKLPQRMPFGPTQSLGMGILVLMPYIIYLAAISDPSRLSVGKLSVLSRDQVYGPPEPKLILGKITLP